MNILRSLIISTIVLLSIGCDGEKSNLSDEELAAIVADMHITENAIGRHDEVLRDSLSVLYLEKLAEIHDITKEEIKYEVELMMENPKRQSEIYGIVIKKLQEIEKEVKAEKISKEKEKIEIDE